MINNKNHTYTFERNGISAEVNANCSQDDSISLTFPQVDDGNRFCVDVQSVFINGINIYDFIRNSEIEEQIITKGEELCFGLFNEL
jgi:hypothetical protein